MLTAYADLPEFRAAVEAGLAFAAIMKPWERRDIVDVVARATGTAPAGPPPGTAR